MKEFVPLLLCGGFGTRLERDLKAAVAEQGTKNGNEPLAATGAVEQQRYGNLPPLEELLGLPKGLLPVNRKPLLDYWVEMFVKYHAESTASVLEVFLICNGLHESLFKDWACHLEASFGGKVCIKIACNGITENANRNGSVADLKLAIDTFHLASPPESKLLVVAGDTLLTRFDINEFLTNCEAVFAANPECGSILVHYTISDAETRKSGVLELEETASSVSSASHNVRARKCIGFKEKPGPEGTNSRLGCPCFYLLRGTATASIPVFLQEKQGMGLDAIDASGKWVQWIVESQQQERNSFGTVFSLPIHGRLDIGGLSSFVDADEYMRSI